MMTDAAIQTIMHKNPQIWTVNSILTQNYGEVLLLDNERACINVTNFYFIEGSFLESFGKQLIEHITLPAIITSSNNDWYDYFAEKIDASSERVTRRMYQWDDKVVSLAPYIKKELNSLYKIKPIGQVEAKQIQRLEWAEGVFDSYVTMDEFFRYGFGFCILDQDKVVSLCMSFSHSEYGVEIEVDTDPAYQGQGLGKIVSAHFVLESLKRNIKPLWDATNLPSAKIAEAIGFHFMKEYKALWSK